MLVPFFVLNVYPYPWQWEFYLFYHPPIKQVFSWASSLERISSPLFKVVTPWIINYLFI
jgi:hypothetical protein